MPRALGHTQAARNLTNELADFAPLCGIGEISAGRNRFDHRRKSPLFFDHPLDHVSGLHLSEAISQLVRADVLCRDGADPRDPVFLRRMKFEFPNFCQKAATQITAQRLSTTTGYDYHGEAVQNGKTVARGRLSVGDIPSGSRRQSCARASRCVSG